MLMLKSLLEIYLPALPALNRRTTELPDGTPNSTCEPPSLTVNRDVQLTALHTLGLNDSSKITITVVHDSLRVFNKHKVLGKIAIELEDLLKRQHLHPNEGK